jgi:hypothetical protein
VIVCGAAWIEPEKAPPVLCHTGKAGIRGRVGRGFRRNDENAGQRPVPATSGWRRAVQPSYPAPVTGRRDYWRATAGGWEELKPIDDYPRRRDRAPPGRLIAPDDHCAVRSHPRPPADRYRQPVSVGWLDHPAGGSLDPQPVKVSFRLTPRRKDGNFINIRPE